MLTLALLYGVTKNNFKVQCESSSEGVHNGSRMNEILMYHSFWLHYVNLSTECLNPNICLT